MFKAIHGEAPQWLNNNILMACESHNIATRNASHLNVCIPKITKEIFKHLFQHHGAKYWNDLPDSIKEASSTNTFKKLYKSHFFKK